MSNLPPPGSPGTPPPWQTSLQPGPNPPKRSDTPKLIIGAIVIAVLAGGGVFLATRSDTKSVTSPTQPTVRSRATDVSIADTQATTATTSAAPATAAPTTVATTAPTTVAVTTTTSSTVPTPVTLAFPTITTSLPTASTGPQTAPPSTVAAATTVPFVVPANAVDLGHHVYIPIPAGWTHTVTSSGLDVLASTDGNSKLNIQVLVRKVGEAPSVLMQEYADGFTPSFPAVNLTSTVRFTVSGPVPAYEYGTYYNGYSATAADGIGTNGGLFVFQRADGLSAIYDIFGPTTTMGVGNAAFQAFTNSYEAAPLLGASGNLQAFGPFRVTTTVPLVAISSVVGFTPAPGFTPSTDPGGGVRVSSSDYDFTVKELTAQPSADAALQTAEAALGTEYTGIVFAAQQPLDPYNGLTHIGLGWNGTFTNGSAVTGAIDIFWDPKTMNAISETRAFYPNPDGTEPEIPQVRFMSSGVSDDISFGIPNP
jgi:hypothetical protein